MTLQQLQYIVALDTHRNFVKAAEHSFVTQPTLTMQVKKLEEELGTVIFNRYKTPLQPTRAGEKIIEKARIILNEANQLYDLVKAEKEEMKGDFKLGVIPTIAPYLLPLILSSFVEKYPEARLIIEELQSEDIISSLKKEKIDVGILATPLEEKNLREIPLYYEPFLVYVSPEHPLYQVDKVKEEDLTSEGLWLLSHGHCFRNQTLNICHYKEETERKKGFIYESGSIEALKNMVRNNNGYTLVPEMAVLQEVDSPYLKRIEGEEPVREISLATYAGYPKQFFLHALKDLIVPAVPERFTKNEKPLKIKWR